MNGNSLLIERGVKNHRSVANMDALVDDSLLPARVLGRVLALSAVYVHRRHTLDAARCTLPHIRRRARLSELLERVRKHYSDNGALSIFSGETTLLIAGKRAPVSAEWQPITSIICTSKCPK